MESKIVKFKETENRNGSWQRLGGVGESIGENKEIMIKEYKLPVTT